ncbi:MAG: neutral/alkaline non-lysosomal ceramidase N-terminal domain-containing protein [Rhodospirillaceae bacterium]|nr:neutral/alkaline non-lysosomal ceramidase N-terminal domain-containing protein [Rhodospirillaceae bacterium]
MGTRLQAGFARTDITPDLGCLLLGYPDPDRRAESVRDRLNANALYLEQNSVRAVILSLDVCIVDDVEVESIRQGIYDRTGIPSDHITVCAIQTHSGPCTIDCWGWSEKDKPYIDRLVERSIEAAVTAAQSPIPVTVGIGTTQSDVGVNRREVLENHEVALGVNPWGPYDPDMTLLRFEGKDGPLVSLIHYGAHPTVFSSANRAVSRDWPGVMIDRVEHLTGVPTFFVNGAVGDIAPRTNSLRAVGDGEMALMEAGGRAGMDAMRAYRSIKTFQDLPLSIINGDIMMPYRSLPPLEEAERAFALTKSEKDEPGKGMCEYKHWEAVIHAHKTEPLPGTTYRQVITALGPIAFVPFPGEPFAEIVLRLRQYSPFQYTLCASTSCGSYGYFATRDSLHRGGYEVWVAKAFGAYILAENIDDVLVEENLALLRNLHDL